VKEREEAVMGVIHCFECGKDLTALPNYLGALPGMKMRCQECSERSQAERPVVTLEMLNQERHQMTISKPKIKRPRELGEEFYQKLVGLQRAA
jgi:hypothetical protein